MAHPRTRARLLLAGFSLLVLVALLFALYGCAAPGGGGALGWLLGGVSANPGPSGGGSGDQVQGMWGGLGHSISTTAGQIRWWFGLGGLACFGVAVWKVIAGEWITAAKCLAGAVGLGIVGAIVGALFEGLAWLAVVIAGVLGIFIAVQWARGGSVFGHSLGCVLGWVSGGRLGHKLRHKANPEVTP